jgi:ubiquinone biosynthesis protein COQ9
MTRPYIKRWPEALAVMAHPTNTVMSFAQLGKLVDDIWYYAGDKSPDVRIFVVHLYGSLKK